jgi:hypothetical protein
MVGSTHQMTSKDFVKLIKFCSNILHHIPQNKIVSLSTKIEPWLNLHITCSNLQICQIHLWVKLLQLHVIYKMFQEFQSWMRKLFMKHAIGQVQSQIFNICGFLVALHMNMCLKSFEKS